MLHANSTLVSGKIFTTSGHGSHLGHVTNIILMHFYFLAPKRLHTKFGKMAQCFFLSNFNFDL